MDRCLQSTGIHLSSLYLSLPDHNITLVFLPDISLQTFSYYVTLRVTKMLLLVSLRQ